MHLHTTHQPSTTVLTPAGDLVITFDPDDSDTLGHLRDTVTITLDSDGLKQLLSNVGYIDPDDSDLYTHENKLLDHHIVQAALEAARSESAEAETDLGHVLAVTTEWHNEHHGGTYQFCYEQPCKDLRDGAL